MRYLTLLTLVLALPIESAPAAQPARAAGPSSQEMPEAIRALPAFGRIDWTVEKLSFVADGPSAGISGAGMVVVEGKIYLCGGFIPGGDETKDRGSRRTSRWAHRYDLQAGEWTRLPDMPGRREYTRAIAADGELYVLGGACQFKGGSPPYRPFGDCFRLDLSTATAGWESVASLAVPRTHMAVGRVGKWLVVAGGNQYDFEKKGYHSSTISGVTEVLDLEEPNRGWKSRTPIPGDPRGWTASAVCGERLYVLGGLTFSDRGKATRLAQTVCYDPAQDHWTDCTAPPVPISGWEAATFAGRYLIAVGGVIASPTDLRLHLWNDLPLAYDTREDRWLKIQGPLPPGALFNDSGVCVLGDTIYVAGAEGPSGTHFNYWLVGKIVPEK